MNELYKTVTTDVWSITLFYLLFLVMIFSTAIFSASVIKTAIDYFFARQLQYIVKLTSISEPYPPREVESGESSGKND